MKMNVVNKKKKTAIGYMPAAMIGTPAAHGITSNRYGTWKNGMKKIDKNTLKTI